MSSPKHFHTSRMLPLCLLAMASVTYAQYSGGSGEPNDPYQIASAIDLIHLGETPDDYGKHFILTADIDLDPNGRFGKVWDRAVIAPDTNGLTPWVWDGPAFTGVLDGNNRTIAHLTIAGTHLLGLFGRLDFGAKISNLHLEAVDVSGTGYLYYIGSLAGCNEGSISACSSRGVVTGGGLVGGLVGYNGWRASVAGSWSTGLVDGDHVGGLIGRNDGSVVASFSNSAVTGDWIVGGLVGTNGSGARITGNWSIGTVGGGEHVGGLVGSNRGDIATSWSDVTLVGYECVGGLVGSNEGGVVMSHSTGVVTCTGAWNAGGLTGVNEGDITTSYSKAIVSGQWNVGGLVGLNEGSITSSYGRGAATGQWCVGGLVGTNMGDTTASYSAGMVVIGNWGGGFIGNNPGDTILSFWDVQTSGQTTSHGGVGKSTAAMQAAATFLDAGWDFVEETENGTEDIWRILEGQDYPHLWWEPEVIEWVWIDDPGVPNHEGFAGYMSKHEITNAQYCQFLNAALADGLIEVQADRRVYAVDDATFSHPFYATAERYTYPGPAISFSFGEGAFSVVTLDNQFMGDHPVLYVSWYGAMAFCEYYGYRLPTEWEWLAVADYDGSFRYGCGATIGPDTANYDKANPLGFSEKPFTTPVGYYGEYGYGLCDMAGNVGEWTSSTRSSAPAPNMKVFLGGCWEHQAHQCEVSYVLLAFADQTWYTIGFRVCR